MSSYVPIISTSTPFHNPVKTPPPPPKKRQKINGIGQMQLMMIPTTMNNSLMFQLFGLVFSLVQLLLCLKEAVIQPLPKY